MKLESLKLTNFRGFRELRITFAPSFTVLLGCNMAGKTAVLDAAALALSRIPDPEHGRAIVDDEVHRVVVTSGGVPTPQPQLPVGVDAAISDDRFDHGTEVWSFTRESQHTRSHGPYTIQDGSFDDDLPVLASYSIRRHADGKPPTDDAKVLDSRYDAYAGAFDIQSTVTTIRSSQPSKPP